MERAERDDGSAMIEFVWLSIILMVPFVYALISVFAVQRGAFGVTQAAREAGRAIATAGNVHDGVVQADDAMTLALSDQHVGGTPTLTVVPVGTPCNDSGNTAAASLAAGARFTVCVSVDMPLPYAGQGFGRLASVHVAASTLVTVDRYRSAP